MEDALDKIRCWVHFLLLQYCLHLIGISSVDRALNCF